MEGAVCPERNKPLAIEGNVIHPLSQLNVKKCSQPPMSTGGRCQMVCLDNGQVAVGNESELHRYDTSKNTWYAFHEHELPVKDFALAVYQSQLLLIGGVITTLTPSVPIHNVVTGAITKPPPSKFESVTDQIWYLDDERGWTESPLLSPMPSARSNSAAVVDGDLLIVANGPGIMEGNGVDIFDGKSWRLTVYVQGVPMNRIDRYSHKKYRVDLAIHNHHLYVLSEYLNCRTKQISYKFFGSVSVQSLLESSSLTTGHKYSTWTEVEFLDGYASNPIAYKGYFISVVAVRHNNKPLLGIHVFNKLNNLWGVVMTNPHVKFTPALPCVIRLPTQELMVMIGGESDAFMMSTEVPPYCPTACDTSITYFSLVALEDLAGIPILSQLRGKKLDQFKDQAGFNLYPVTETSPDPVFRYIFSWATDGRQRELTRKPSWQNFIQVLKEIDLGELAKQIEDFFIRTCPAGPQQKKEVSAIDEIAAVHRDLECLFEELSGEQQPTAQVSAIAQKVAACRDRCYSAFSLLGKEKKAYESKIESLQKTPADQVEDSKQRAMPTLPVLLKELLSKVASNWENIGVLLGIDDGPLSKIKADNHGESGNCLREMLRVWLKKVDPPPSWNLIVDALKSLGEEKLAQELNEKYCV